MVRNCFAKGSLWIVLAVAAYCFALQIHQQQYHSLGVGRANWRLVQVFLGALHQALYAKSETRNHALNGHLENALHA